MNKHDEHYKETEKSGIEPIALMETIMRREGLDAVVSLHIAMAVRYLFRAGTKGDWRSDTEKALNHVTKALTGEWIKEEAPVPSTMRKRWELMKTFIYCSERCKAVDCFFSTENNINALTVLKERGFVQKESERTYFPSSKGLELFELWKGVPIDKWHAIKLFEQVAKENPEGLCETDEELNILAKADLIQFKAEIGFWILTQKGRDFWALWSQLPEKW